MPGKLRGRTRGFVAESKGGERDSEIEGSGQVAHVAPDTRQRFEIEPPGDQLQDRRRVVTRVIDEAVLREWRDDDRRNARPGSPAIAPGRWHVVPEAAVLVVGDDDRRARPNGARL